MTVAEDPIIRSYQADIARLEAALRAIERRSTAHPSDIGADRKRDLYHIHSLARNALAGSARP